MASRRKENYQGSLNTSESYDLPDPSDVREEVARLEREIAELPVGYISRKTINGKVRLYQQWTVDGKKKSKYLNDEAAKVVSQQIEKRRELEKKLRTAKAMLPKKTAYPKATEALYPSSGTWHSYGLAPSAGVAVAETPDEYIALAATSYINAVLIGKALRNYILPAARFRKRDCLSKLEQYIHGENDFKVFILYGLRRTGKTTMIKQALLDMDEKEFSASAVIQVKPGITLKDINADLKLLASQGFHNVFLDEVTLAKDFIEGAALLSDIYAASGLKVILSGTDSLGFILAKSDELYDRCILAHTTWIPYREFEHVLGIRGIDEYIRYGGTMSMSGDHYNTDSTFVTTESTDEYIDDAIAKNIQHSLRYYQDSGHFRHLVDLYEKNELTSAVNRVVEDINHRFTVDVLTRDFISHDLGLSARNLRKDRNDPNDILDHVDESAFTEGLRHTLEILNKPEQTVQITEAHATEIKEYLDMLDLTVDIPVGSVPVTRDIEYRTAIAQPGLRYAQAEALIDELFLDPVFQSLSSVEKSYVKNRILDEIKGRMMEDIVLLETKKVYPRKDVMRLQFAAGEFDMLVTDPLSLTCEIYEIKHSTEVAPEQYRHLIDEEKCSAVSFHYGDITRKAVIYRGPASSHGEIEYINVEDYLNDKLHPA